MARDNSSQTLQQTSKPFVTRIVRLATRLAEFVGVYVRAIENNAELQKPVRFPEQFYFEAAALMQLSQWERAGLTQFLPRELPRASDVEESLWQRMLQSPTEFARGSSGTRLMQVVLHAWLNHIAPSGAEELGADVALQTTNNQELMQQFADLLWGFRHLCYGE